MAAISDALDMPHHDCGRGSNVEGRFLVAIADALGLGPQATGSIEDTIDLLVEHLTDRRGRDLHSQQGTITNVALEVILRGILKGGHAVVPLDHGAPATRIALTLAGEEGGSEAQNATIDHLELSDERKRSLRNVVVREGQGAFRKTLLRAYGGRCAITGTAIEGALEAAHIRPYRGPQTNFASNGILLRADLHRMWDLGLLAVHEHGRHVLLADQVTEPEYIAMRGLRSRIPADRRQWPSPEALQQQREWAGL